MIDERIRRALSPLRGVPIPEAPEIRAESRGPRVERPIAALAAGVMIAAALLAALFLPLTPVPRTVPPQPVVQRLAAAEDRIRRVEDEELQSLLRAKARLLRRKWEISTAGERP